MGYQKLKGDHIFDGKRLWESNHILVLDDKGKLVDVIAEEEAGDNIEYHAGLITPGFVNAHCHLELSHLKNTIPTHTQLVPFLLNVVNKRDALEEDVHRAITAAIIEMENDGIIGVGDICNNSQTSSYKKNGNLQWRNFIEVFSMTDAQAEENMKRFENVLREFDGEMSSLSPHAPYSVSPYCFSLLNEATIGKTISIHNQETIAENELYQTGKGEFLKLFAHFGFASSPFPITGTTSVRHFLPFFKGGQKIILVHNTFMPEEDIIWANEYASHQGIELVYCFCVNANIYIENKLPDIEKFIRNNCQIVLGTDSYSSNWQLKITGEILSVHKKFPAIPLETILQWATVNGSAALGFHSRWITGSDLIQRVKNG